MVTAVSEESELFITAKAREIQRGMLAEMRGDRAAAERHLLAAAHMELVLAEDYAAAGQELQAARSKVSAGSCFWRAGEVERGRQVLEEVIRNYPMQAAAARNAIDDLLAGGMPV